MSEENSSGFKSVTIEGENVVWATAHATLTIEYHGGKEEAYIDVDSLGGFGPVLVKPGALSGQQLGIIAYEVEQT